MPTDWMNYLDNELYGTNIIEAKKYLYMMYYAVLYLTLNEIGPVTPYECAMSILILLTC